MGTTLPDTRQHYPSLKAPSDITEGTSLVLLYSVVVSFIAVLSTSEEGTSDGGRGGNDDRARNSW